jgi:asparagine synthetase B (glutamine-hydrolysing)
MLREYPEILRHFSQPRFNLWPYWLAKAQKQDDRLNVYIGEGGDEHFGGYWYKPKNTYIGFWQGFYEYVIPTYKTVYDMFGLNLNIPMHPDNLDWTKTYPYYDHNEEKQFFREAYKGILPDFVVERRKLNGRKNYFALWGKELEQYFPDAHPTSEEEIRVLWQTWCTREWLKSHGVSEIRTDKPILCHFT